ncbi:hypothetical protein C4577_03615 [Candidatus Parcubacteria bacterium]|nr:MAG: hypothetical protein C4577_03615 [Candidatus Parcubacteria bacterium]
MESCGLTVLLLSLFLDSYAFSARHQAHNELEKMGVIAIPQMTLVIKETKSLEAYVRLKRLINRQNTALVSSMVNGLPPYIDSIPEEGLGELCSCLNRHDVVNHYLQLARSESLMERLIDEQKTMW